MFFPIGAPSGDPVPLVDLGHRVPCQGHSALVTPGSDESGVEKSWSELEGSSILEMGLKVQQWLLGVIPLRGQTTGRRGKNTLFPLPTSSSKLLACFPSLCPLELVWLVCVCAGLNSLWGGDVWFDGEVNQVCKDCLVWLVKDVKRLQSLNGKLERFDWDQFFNTRGIDYKGDEVKTAREFCWGNIAPALPKEIGRVPLAEVCSLGARHYVENLDLYIKPREKWIVRRAPRVMVPEAEWPKVCTGLVRSGVCALMPADELFRLTGDPSSMASLGSPRMNGKVALRFLG
jgi:hypothetical protein